MTPTMIPKENNLDTLATAISTINSELTLNKTTILVSNSKITMAGIVIPKFESKILVKPIIISKDNRRIRNVDHRSRWIIHPCNE